LLEHTIGDLFLAVLVHGWHFPASIPLLNIRHLSTKPFSLCWKLKVSSQRKEYCIDARAKPAAKFFLRCMRDPDPQMRVKIPAAMKAKGHSKEESKD
jgi:hypothetical protein